MADIGAAVKGLKVILKGTNKKLNIRYCPIMCFFIQLLIGRNSTAFILNY